MVTYYRVRHTWSGVVLRARFASREEAQHHIDEVESSGRCLDEHEIVEISEDD